MKELRFSIQCGASNRKALKPRRCSQCKLDQIDTELDTITQQRICRSQSNRSSSTASGHFGTTLQPPKHRATIERTSDLDKFDTLLMLAAERTNRLDAHRKQQRFSSTSPQRRTVPLILVEQQTPNHLPNIRSEHVRCTNTGIFYFC